MAALAPFDETAQAHPLAVALSGGADSTALLLAAVQRWPGRVQAVHIHHGLQAAADDFVRHCERLCARLAVPLTVLRVDARAARGESPEAAARDARYGALTAWARGHDSRQGQPGGPTTLLLGQHADDQLESVLLALTRGAGVAGLAGMAPWFERGGVQFARPWLRLPAQALRDWLCCQGVHWIEDPSNDDSRFTRNRIRRLLPVLLAAFPALRDTVARSARLCAQADALLAELGQQDVAALSPQADAPPGTDPAGQHQVDARPDAELGDERALQRRAPDAGLRLAGLQALSRARQANAVRAWLRTVHQTAPSEAQLDALLDQVAACRTRGHRIHLKVGRGHVRRAGDALQWQA
ncbi:tRNA lysidine(34) synthetase TilS [Comamonas serinivorans]|uniref:tRNA lysidine(34) synthetase TilS n=1 Tax=Comamonas serinivorans TaxID=1082851 RepID=UPI001F01DF09|nr:tRNA lysidine(34) synthetase TilS [Comamonas serinivorans]